MTSRERVTVVLNLCEPDRVPVFELAINAPAASEIMGREMRVGIGGRMMGPGFGAFSQRQGTPAALVVLFLAFPAVTKELKTSR